MQNLKCEPIKTAHSVSRDQLHFRTFYSGQKSALTRLDELVAGGDDQAGPSSNWDDSSKLWGLPRTKL